MPVIHPVLRAIHQAVCDAHTHRTLGHDHVPHPELLKDLRVLRGLRFRPQVFNPRAQQMRTGQHTRLETPAHGHHHPVGLRDPELVQHLGAGDVRAHSCGEQRVMTLDGVLVGVDPQHFHTQAFQLGCER